MKMSKFLSLVLCVTCVSLLYVYQQTEIFRFAYLGQKKQCLFDDLLDKNTVLRYNIKRNGSLVYIGSKIAKSNDFQMPESYRLVKLAPDREGALAKSRTQPIAALAARIFSVKSEVQAKTINP